MNHSHAYFCNRDCAYYPCHGVDAGADFNCLFCFCPLYAKADCGGAFVITSQGVKDCSACTFPHDPTNYEAVIEKLSEEPAASD